MNAENSSLPRDYLDSTRYVRPVKCMSFGERDMVQCFSQYFNADEILSLAQLVGDRKGVIRVTLKSRSAVKKFDELLSKKKLLVMSVPLGIVNDQGQFQTFILDNVPQCIKDDQLEEFMGRFGVVAGSTREYLDFKGYKIENERRTVLYTAVFTHSSIPAKFKIYDSLVYCKSSIQAPKEQLSPRSQQHKSQEQLVPSSQQHKFHEELSPRPQQKFSPMERQNFLAAQNLKNANSIK